MSSFLNADLSEDVTILTQPAPELVQFGLVKPGTLYQCTKAWFEDFGIFSCALRPQTVRLPDESNMPDVSVFGEQTHCSKSSLRG